MKNFIFSALPDVGFDNVVVLKKYTLDVGELRNFLRGLALEPIEKALFFYLACVCIIFMYMYAMSIMPRQLGFWSGVTGQL